jgi:hypothetical protein
LYRLRFGAESSGEDVATVHNVIGIVENIVGLYKLKSVGLIIA